MADEKIFLWVKTIVDAKKKNGSVKEYFDAVDVVKAEAGNKLSGGASKYVWCFGSSDVVDMMVLMLLYGGHFRYSDTLKVSHLQGIVKVYRGVSDSQNN
jgi:hypothetical protein